MPDAPRLREDLLCISRGGRGTSWRPGKEGVKHLCRMVLSTPHVHAHAHACAPPAERLNEALGAIRVLGVEPVEDELEPHLKTVLSSIEDKTEGAPEQVVVSGVLPILALSLRRRGPLAPLTAKLVAELAKEPAVRGGFGDAGLVPAVLALLTSTDPELLHHAARAASRMCRDSPELQELLLRRGAVPRLVAVLLRVPAEERLEDACLLALCNLSGMGVSEEAGLVWERGVSVRPGESLFRAVSRHTCGFTFSLIEVRVSRRAPAQYVVDVEVARRYSPGCWSLRGSTGTIRTPLPLFDPGGDSKTWKVSKVTRRVPQSRSLKTRVFHSFL
ncbi:rap1 GTPase-GDP dissociation stimulator 1-A [Takifugu flavidus]|uniref:rap1 GTPase-GDP dissociation stimulator 1-A n=1 Tax=Takifugu flavidus TaxID=433684 RepID=UPI002544955C|nr:rap1 GTPase-GDP dissociation stimulator 1-A [Takifugu flavidus]